MTEVNGKKTQSLLQKNFDLAEYRRSVWTAMAREGITEQELLEPSYWAHNAEKMKMGDRIEVESEDGSVFYELYVKAVGRNWAQVLVMRKFEISSSAELPEEQKEFDIKFKGRISKWCVVRIKDNAMLTEGLESKEEAALWVREHSKAVAA